MICTLNLTSLGKEVVSLSPDEELVKQAHSKVEAGGLWRPDDCKAQVKGTSVIVI